MKKILLNGPYSDELGNKVICEEVANFLKVEVTFKGKNNILIIANGNGNLANLNISFPSDNGVCIIGKSKPRGTIRVGFNSLLMIGDGVTCTDPFFLCSVEQTKILIGDDCMFATNIHVRTDTAHAIYDVETGRRLSLSEDIVIGAHTWISFAAKIFGGSCIGDGSIVGINSITKTVYPNNCTIAGSPGKCVRKNIAWERPNIGTTTPWIKAKASQIKKTEIYWNMTDEKGRLPRLGEGYINLYRLLKLHCPDSLWLEDVSKLINKT